MVRVTVGKDSRLPKNTGFKILGSVRGIDKESRVKNFIDSDLGIWKKGLIFVSFNPSELKQIVSIPLSFRNTEDRLIWHHERNGEFSVCSAYHINFQNKVAKHPGPSSVPYYYQDTKFSLDFSEEYPTLKIK